MFTTPIRLLRKELKPALKELEDTPQNTEPRPDLLNIEPRADPLAVNIEPNMFLKVMPKDP